jgi:hypothetical protein
LWPLITPRDFKLNKIDPASIHVNLSFYGIVVYEKKLFK